MKIIAISGWKRSGKDTAAEYLIDVYGYKKLAFADALRSMVSEEYGIPLEQLEQQQYKEQPLLHLPVIPRDDFSLSMAKMLFTEFRTEGGLQAIEPYQDPSGAFLGVMGRHVEQLYWTPRALMILKGSVNRSVTSDYWIDRTIAEVGRLLSVGHKNIVISDLRFKRELDMLREAFGPDLTTIRVERFDTNNSDSATEKDLDKTPHDVVLLNKSTVKEFYSKLEELIKSNQ